MGYIFNKEGKARDATDNFLKGLGGGAGVTLRNVRVGVATPLGAEKWSLTNPRAIEIGLSTQKAGWDGGISVNEESVNLVEQYEKSKVWLSK